MSPPGSRSSTPPYDLAEFGSANTSVNTVWCPRMCCRGQIYANQGSQESSEQLSPNRVRSDFDVDTVALYPLLGTSPRSDGALLLIYRITSPELYYDMNRSQPMAL